MKHLAVAVAVVALAACEAAAPNPGDVGIERIEVTQGIQNVLGQVPLLADKPTFVRVMVRGNDEGGAAIPSVGARLTVDGGDPIGPIGRADVTPPAAGSNPRTLDDSFVFALPPDLIGAGAHAIHVELVLPSGVAVSADARLDADYTATFGPAIPFRIYGARYGYRNVPPELQTRVGLTSSTWPARPWTAFDDQRVGAEQMLPVSSLAIDHLPTDAITEVDCRYDAVSGGCAGYVDGRTFAQATIDAAFPQGGQTIVMLQPEFGNGHYGYWFVSAAGNNVINLQGDTVDIGATLAHEIGHSLGLAHTFEDSHYPRPDGALGPYVALRGTPLGVIPGDDATGRPTASDIMSYNFTSWISPYSYCKALVATSGRRLMCPHLLDEWDRP